MLKDMIVILSAFAFVGCEDIDGQLQVFEKFNVNTKNGVRVTEIGNFETSLDIKRDRIVASIKSSSGKTKVTFMVPGNLRLPANGDFEITSADSCQPFDMTGINKTVESKSKTKSEYQDCIYEGWDVICSPQGCTQVPVRRWGRQYTKYYARTVKQDLIMNAMSASADLVAATFTGAASRSEKIIVEQDQCF